MGLDMYLYAERYVSGFREKDAALYTALDKLTADMPPAYDKVAIVVRKAVGYWRKANAIHGWFVDNCQGGRDECQDTYVSREQLTELRDLCKRVLENHELAPDELPTCSGFFFGSTDYDEAFFDDLELTVRIIDECLALDPDIDFQYHSSW